MERTFVERKWIRRWIQVKKTKNKSNLFTDLKLSFAIRNKVFTWATFSGEPIIRLSCMHKLTNRLLNKISITVFVQVKYVDSNEHYGQNGNFLIASF
jgi:hypothetical protein